MMNPIIHGHFMVQGQQQQQQLQTTYPSDVDTVPHPLSPLLTQQSSSEQKQQQQPQQLEEESYPLLISDVPLSFWGGIDPVTGIIVDQNHPLIGQCVRNTILCLPSGRGSCTASQVLLELILNQIAPRAIVLRDLDGMVAIGAIVAEEILRVHSHLDILHVGTASYQKLLDYFEYSTKNEQTNNMEGILLPNGTLIVGTKGDHVKNDTNMQSLKLQQQQHPPNPLVFQPHEQVMLHNARSEAERMALRVIFRYAQLTCTNKNNDTNNNNMIKREYVPVQSAHIDACTYIGPGGIRFVQTLLEQGGSVCIPTTLNAVSTDRQQWQKFGVPKEYASNSITLGDAYLALGCTPSFTCAPYLLPQPPLKEVQQRNSSNNMSTTTTRTTTGRVNKMLGQHIAWGESNAVVYANSVWGARTEKYADYLDGCCAITGIVPVMGIHVETNRQPTIVLDGTNLFKTVQSQFVVVLDQNEEQQSLLSSSGSTAGGTTTISDLDLLFPTLGHLCGTLSDGRVPLVLGLENWSHLITLDHLKAFCAAFGTTGSSPLIHIAGITPEVVDPDIVQKYRTKCSETNQQVVELTMEQLTTTFHKLDSCQGDDHNYGIDLVALGNPHLSTTECKELARLIRSIVDKEPTTASKTTTTTTLGIENNNNNQDSVTTTVTAKTRIMACMSRTVHELTDPEDLHTIQNFGIELIFDTCWCMLLNEPIIPINVNATILTNSGKYAHYGPGLTNRTFRYGSLQDCIQAAHRGVYPKRRQQQQQHLIGTTITSSLFRFSHHHHTPSVVLTSTKSVRSMTTYVKKTLSIKSYYNCHRTTSTPLLLPSLYRSIPKLLLRKRL